VIWANFVLIKRIGSVVRAAGELFGDPEVIQPNLRIGSD
jgi:hypothetical protein